MKSKNQIAWICEKICKMRFLNFYTNQNKILGKMFQTAWNGVNIFQNEILKFVYPPHK